MHSSEDRWLRCMYFVESILFCEFNEGNRITLSLGFERSPTVTLKFGRC